MQKRKKAKADSYVRLMIVINESGYIRNSYQAYISTFEAIDMRIGDRLMTP